MILNNAYNIMFNNNEVYKVYLGSNEIWTKNVSISNYFDPNNMELQGDGLYSISYENNIPILGLTNYTGNDFPVYFRLYTEIGKKYRFYTQCDAPRIAQISLNGYLQRTVCPLNSDNNNSNSESWDLSPVPDENNPFDFIAQGETTLVFRTSSRGTNIHFTNPQVVLLDTPAE